MEAKTYITSKDDFLKNRAPAAAGAIFFTFGGFKKGAKIDQKSIKKSHATWSVSWHRFLVDFHRFSEPSWGGKSIKNRCQRVWKSDRKKHASRLTKKSHQDRYKGGWHLFWGGSLGPAAPWPGDIGGGRINWSRLSISTRQWAKARRICIYYKYGELCILI